MDNNTYKILEYVYRGNTCKLYGTTVSKFKNHTCPSAEDSLFMLGADNMVTIDYSHNDNGNAVEPEFISIAPRGRDFVESKKSQKFADWFARILAIVAIVIAAGSLAVAIIALFQD